VDLIYQHKGAVSNNPLALKTHSVAAAILIKLVVFRGDRRKSLDG